MKYFMGHKRFAAIFVIVAVIFAGMVMMSQWGGAKFSALPSSARNMVSALSVAATEIVGDSFGIGVADDGIMPGGEAVVVDAGGDVAMSSDGENSSRVSAPAATSAMQPFLSVTEVPLEVSEIPLPTDPALSSSSEKISCTFPSALTATSSFSGRLIFNEIAWMGSPSSSLPAGANEGGAEWMELKNNSSGTIALAGWKIEDASGKIAIRFGESDRIGAGGFFLLMRGSTTFPYAHASEISYSGNMKNDGEYLVIFDPLCGISDYIAAMDGWPSGDNAAKKTMERDAAGGGWHTSAVAGGTPGAENSLPVVPVYYGVTAVFSGAGGAAISSDPAGIACDAAKCSGSFEEGTKVKLVAVPATGTVFGGWSGACSGKGACAFTVKGKTDVAAMFRIPDASPRVEESLSIPSSSAAIPSSTRDSPGSVLIVAVQIAGAASSNDYVRLYNPTAAPIVMEGWKLKKRSATGAEYSLRTFPLGTTIGAGGYFTWANSKDSFAASFGADVSSTETLAADNSIALIAADGSVDDALAWGVGSGQFGEGYPFPTNPPEGQILVRTTAGNVPIDTGDNGKDFILQ